METLLNHLTINFIHELKTDSNVLGIILFGSWARGNNRPDSDVDLVVILKEGYKRTVEYREAQAFEIIYTTEKSAFDFWESHRDDAIALWEVVKILYDVDNKITNLKEKITNLLNEGKPEIEKSQQRQMRFDAEDTLRYVENIYPSNSTVANLLLFNKVFGLTELYFDLRRIWTPPPKLRLQKIQEISPKFYDLLIEFYEDNATFENRLSSTKQMITIIFNITTSS